METVKLIIKLFCFWANITKKYIAHFKLIRPPLCNWNSEKQRIRVNRKTFKTKSLLGFEDWRYKFTWHFLVIIVETGFGEQFLLAGLKKKWGNRSIFLKCCFQSNAMQAIWIISRETYLGDVIAIKLLYNYSLSVMIAS